MKKFPEDFIAEMENILGAETGELFESLNKEPVKGVRFRKRIFGRCCQNSDAEVSLKIKNLTISDCADDIEIIPWEPTACYMPKGDFGKDPLHSAGAYYIQEPSAMVPAAIMVRLLRGARGRLRILDLCSAPGGKGTKLGEAFAGRGTVFLNEIHPKRAMILSENVERMGLYDTVVINENPIKLAEYFPGYFHGILVDAPCSGEGMFRKDEGAVDEWSRENVLMCAKRQEEILDCAVKMLAPGGVLVYSTCTFSLEENEANVKRLIKNNACLKTMDHHKIVEELKIPGGVPGEYGIRLWPHKVKGEGHFAAALKDNSLGTDPEPEAHNNATAGTDPVPEARNNVAQGTDPVPEGRSNVVLGTDPVPEGRENVVLGTDPEAKEGSVPGLSVEELSKIQLFVSFWEGNVPPLPEGKILMFGNNIYLAPTDLPDLRGIKVLRPGLHLGTMINADTGGKEGKGKNSKFKERESQGKNFIRNKAAIYKAAGCEIVGKNTVEYEITGREKYTKSLKKKKDVVSTKIRFEPSHALALWLNPLWIPNVIDISHDRSLAIKYLKGETINIPDQFLEPKGYDSACAVPPPEPKGYDSACAVPPPEPQGYDSVCAETYQESQEFDSVCTGEYPELKEYDSVCAEPCPEPKGYNKVCAGRYRSCKNTIMLQRGQTLNSAETNISRKSPKDLSGWVIVSYKGFSLGWGKAVNRIIKNHYPKGLRWN